MIEIELKIFNNNDFGSIRTMMIENEPHFVARDIALALGYKDTSDAVKRHVDSEDKLTRCFTDTGQSREMYVINESGLYSLILSSKLPNAKQFKRWVTSDVLPSIRKFGMYATDDLINNPDLLIKVATQLKNEREQRIRLETQVKKQTPKVFFANSVSASKTSILVGDLAKLLKQNGLDIGALRLFEKLRNEGWLIKRQGSDWNMPTQKAMELGLFEIKERTINNPDGSIRITKTPKVTGKGQIYFINKYLEME
ncbi:phage antirepressor [Globicatella sulfidifaciens]